jgi:transketolase
MIEAQPNRVVYGRTLVELGESNPRIVVLDADVPKSTNTSQFQERFPDRFFNVGIAEQNMMGIAAGLATTGKIPFASTFAVFATMRACEQVRTSIAYPRLNVKIVATNAGVENYGDGVTHQAVEDLAIMRAIAHMVVLSPSDPITTRLATLAAARYHGPVYMRLGRNPNNVVHDKDVKFEIGKMIVLREGCDVTLIATGRCVEQALIAAEKLALTGVQARVLDCHTIKPVDSAEILRSARETAGIVTAEDHNIIGGLGGAVCEVVASECPTVVRRVGLADRFASSGRGYAKLLSHYHIDATEITKYAEEVLARRSCSPAPRP